MFIYITDFKLTVIYVTFRRLYIRVLACSMVILLCENNFTTVPQVVGANIRTLCKT